MLVFHLVLEDPPPPPVWVSKLGINGVVSGFVFRGPLALPVIAGKSLPQARH